MTRLQPVCQPSCPPPDSSRLGSTPAQAVQPAGRYGLSAFLNSVFLFVMDDYKLIQYVREHKCLYDTNDQHYKETLIRDNVWKEISEGMQQTREYYIIYLILCATFLWHIIQLCGFKITHSSFLDMHPLISMLWKTTSGRY